MRNAAPSAGTAYVAQIPAGWAIGGWPITPRASRRLAFVAAIVIAAADAALQFVHPSVVLAGALDEPAHAATTVLLLAAFGWPLGWRFAVAAVIASMAIDLDHIPHYLGTRFLTAGTHRPYTHSWVTPAFFAVLAAALRGRWRVIALGAELGLIGHLFRDMAEPGTTTGVPLFWPFSDASLRLPYLVYALVMAAALVATIVRARSRRMGAAGPVSTAPM
jgi:inner membrane protein